MRDVTALDTSRAQIPVSLVRLVIPDVDTRIHDLDVDLYLNPTTNAVSMSSGAGLLLFSPHAGLTVPQISSSDAEPLNEVVLSLSNQNGAWFSVLGANTYKNAEAHIWQGNLSLAAGTSPFAATFTGAVVMWSGEITHMEANYETATITLGPPDMFRMPIPRRTYVQSEGFNRIPTPGTKINWGFTVRTV